MAMAMAMAMVLCCVLCAVCVYTIANIGSRLLTDFARRLPAPPQGFVLRVREAPSCVSARLRLASAHGSALRLRKAPPCVMLLAFVGGEA